MTNKDSKMKKCFIVMPISDQDGYEKGHFTRVYNHIIRPACEKAGFEAIRADDEVKTNYIALDIVKKIIESDLVLCDLSSKNPNVLYELGIRQAFNKKVVLIKDKKTGRIFDIQGFRTIDYDENLRIDEVEKSILSISNTLKETSTSKVGEVNSFIQLLSIKPAEISKNIEISQESSIIMDMLENISVRISNIEDKKTIDNNLNSNKFTFVGNHKISIGDMILSKTNNDTYDHIGDLIDFDNKTILLKTDTETLKINRNDSRLKDIIIF
jgi:hypothetical protein